MDSLVIVSPSIVLPLRRHQNHYRRRPMSVSFARGKPMKQFRFKDTSRGVQQDNRAYCKLNREDDQEGEICRGDEELERALRINSVIPGTSDVFVKQISSRAYDMRRHVEQSCDSSSYDVLEANPWRETSKSVYVLTHQEEVQNCEGVAEIEASCRLLLSLFSEVTG